MMVQVIRLVRCSKRCNCHSEGHLFGKYRCRCAIVNPIDYSIKGNDFWDEEEEVAMEDGAWLRRRV
jgi:hypothetical protein